MKKYRAFGSPWHLAHDCEILKIPEIQWDWLIRRQYGLVARGDIISQYGVNMVDHYERGKYDFALLHFDQQCFEPKLWARGKGSLFRELNEVITDIPKIIIAHGTPYYPEMFPAKNAFGENCDGISPELISIAKKQVRDGYVIMNSHKATEQWGFGTTIWHGLTPDEWWDLPKEPRVVSMISPAGLDKYYDRAFLSAVRDALHDEDILFAQISVDFIAKNWDEYRNFLGRSLIYFNPTLESPMPRSRTEAMLSGCCVLTTPHQDADRFIRDGENGFIVPRNPEYVVNLVKELLGDYKRAIAIGQRGKETAKKEFAWDRFHKQWLDFVDQSITDYHLKHYANK